MNLKSIFSITFCLLLATPSVFSQRKNRNCTQTVSLDFGSHRVFIDGPFGANIGLTVENTVSQHFSWNLCFRDYFNQSDYVKQIFPTEKVTEHRIAILGGINFYPSAALYGLYFNLNGGGIFHVNTIKTFKPNTVQAGQPLKDLLTSNVGFIYDFKIGYQHVFDSKLLLNPFLGIGLFHSFSSNLNFMIAEPYFQVGIKIGKVM